MTKKQAISAYTMLESLRVDEDAAGDPDCPLFKVRLDADDDGDYGRAYRVRVAEGPAFRVGPEEWRKVIDVAEGAEAVIVIQNNGIELS